MLEKGLVQVYTGNSGDFNFAPLGLALRAAGQGFRTLICCFKAHELMQETVIASSYLKPYIVIDHSAIESSFSQQGAENSFNDKIHAAFARAKKSFLNKEFDIVIFEGIHQIIEQEHLPLQDVLKLIDAKPPNIELVLSGRRANLQIVERADLVTEMVVQSSKGCPAKGHGSKNDGFVEVVTGNGKGKTTYCLGKSMLLSCQGIQTFFLQFIKSPQRYGEVIAIEKLPGVEISSMGEGFVDTRAHFREKHKEAAQRAWEFLLTKNGSQKYKLVVLDEINVATGYGLLPTDRVFNYILNKPRDLNLILSGRSASEKVMEIASRVIEMKEIKHPFRKGIMARKGIEY